MGAAVSDGSLFGVLEEGIFADFAKELASTAVVLVEVIVRGVTPDTADVLGDLGGLFSALDLW